MIHEIQQKIKEADLVLIGIGEAFEIKVSELENNDSYAQALKECRGQECLIPYIEKLFIEESNADVVRKRKETYHNLSAVINDKNYFIVSLCTDGLIHHSDINSERIVEPCGSISKLQCSESCSKELYEVNPGFLQKVRELVEGKQKERVQKIPVCPKCGKPLVFNRMPAENYLEEGYLPQWELYTKWLQGTVNKNLCILELGVGLRYPSVIRWPFEKVAFFNQKASFFRVHSKLYQIAEEIKDRAFGINQQEDEFLRELEEKQNGYR